MRARPARNRGGRRLRVSSKLPLKPTDGEFFGPDYLTLGARFSPTHGCANPSETLVQTALIDLAYRPTRFKTLSIQSFSRLVLLAVALAVIDANLALSNTDPRGKGVGDGPTAGTTGRTAPAARVTIDEIIRVTKDTLIDASSILVLPSGAGLSAPDGVTVTIENLPVAGRYQIFFGEGTFELPGRCNVEWHGARGDGTTPSYHAFRKAKRSVAPGGVVDFGVGTFLMVDRPDEERSRFGGYRRNIACLQTYEVVEAPGQPPVYLPDDGITVRGQGPGNTVLTEPGDSGLDGLRFAVYRSEGWSNDPEQWVTYTENVRKGQRWLELKVPGAAARLRPGDKVYVNSGAATFDQLFGQNQVVERVTDARVYLRYPLSKDFRQHRSSHGATTASSFVVPAAGETATVEMTGADPREPYGANTVTIGDNLLRFEAGQRPGTRTVTNISGKGNAPSGTVVPAGTKVFRYRALRPTPSTTIDATVRDLTLVCSTRGITVSNSIGARLDNVELRMRKRRETDRTPYEPLWLDGDDGSDVRIRNCTFDATDIPITSQLARSIYRVEIEDCTFKNTAFEASEFASSVSLRNCTFDMDYDVAEGEESNPRLKYVLNFGQTCSDIELAGCTIHAKGVPSVVTAARLQSYEATAGGGVVIRDTRFFVDGVNKLIDLPHSGRNVIDNVQAQGSVSTLFGQLGKVPQDRLGLVDGEGRATLGAGTKIRNFYWFGELDALFTRTPVAVDLEIDIVRTGYARTPQGNPTANKNGNLLAYIEEAPAVTPPYDLRVEANIWNWNYTDVNPFRAGTKFGPHTSLVYNFYETVRVEGGQPEDFTIEVNEANPTGIKTK